MSIRLCVIDTGEIWVKRQIGGILLDEWKSSKCIQCMPLQIRVLFLAKSLYEMWRQVNLWLMRILHVWNTTVNASLECSRWSRPRYRISSRLPQVTYKFHKNSSKASNACKAHFNKPLIPLFFGIQRFGCQKQFIEKNSKSEVCFSNFGGICCCYPDY